MEDRTRRRTALVLACVAVCLSGCMKHHLIWPREDPAGVRTWSEDVVRGGLLVHLEWARPAGEGPFPIVLMHHVAGHHAPELRGALRDLADRGYLAAAADYQRWNGKRYQRTGFAWRDAGDPTAALELVRRHPAADPARAALVGFSQGGVYSLLIAAEDPTVRAVVAFYPVTDFRRWLETPRRNPMRRLVFKIIRRHFYRQSGAESEADFDRILAEASPYDKADRIRAPVLLIHGVDDTSAPVEESRHMERRLRELGREVRIIEIDGAGHVFNFYKRQPALDTWRDTLDWLRRHLSEGP